MEIMKTFALGPLSLMTVASLVLGGAPGVFAADVTLQKVPPLTVEQAPAYPENLARHYLGARVESAGKSEANLSAANTALLGGDPTASYALPAGRTSLLIALPKIENIDRISFAPLGTKGTVTIATANAKLAADSPQWRASAPQELTSEVVQAKVGPNEAKYVRLTFDLTEPGKIANLGVYPDPRMSDFTAPRAGNKADDKSASFGLVSYSYTDMHAKARALYVSSGSDVRQANNMIDEQASTNYTFAANDGSPTTVIDLGKPVTLRRLSAVYAPRAGRMEFYVLSALPGEMRAGAEVSPAGEPIPTPESNPETMTLTDASFAALKAVGTTSDDGSQGRASIEFPATSGRYVMVRWLPAANQDVPFSLAEIAAFGNVANSTLLAANTEASAPEPPVETEYQTNRYDGKTMQDGKTLLEPKDMPGEGPAEPPAEGPPPTLPQPPPFTFVPLLVPTSP